MFLLSIVNVALSHMRFVYIGGIVWSTQRV